MCDDKLYRPIKYKAVGRNFFDRNYEQRKVYIETKTNTYYCKINSSPAPFRILTIHKLKFNIMY